MKYLNAITWHDNSFLCLPGNGTQLQVIDGNLLKELCGDPTSQLDTHH